MTADRRPGAAPPAGRPAAGRSNGRRMLTPEFLRTLRRIELRTRKVINSTFVGEYRSTFKGTGMEFVDVREYTTAHPFPASELPDPRRMGAVFQRKG